MTKLDKEYLHHFGTTYSALLTADAPYANRKQLVDDLWDKIQAEFAPEEETESPTDGSEPSTQPGPPSGTTTYRIYNREDNTVWSHKIFLTKSAAVDYLVKHYSGNINYVTKNPFLTNYWEHRYTIREINN